LLKGETDFLANSFGDKLLIGLNVAELTKWPKDMPVRGRTKRNRFSSARTMFRWARKMGYLPDGITAIERVDEAIWADTPADDFKANWEDEDDWDGDCLLIPEQLHDLFKAIPKRLIPTLAFSAFQGIRRSELLRMHWGMVKEDTITVPKIVARKIGKRRVVSFLPATAAWVTPLEQPKGRIVSSNARFNQLTEIAKKVGIDPWPQNVLRHSFINYRLAILKLVTCSALVGDLRTKALTAIPRNSGKREAISLPDSLYSSFGNPLSPPFTYSLNSQQNGMRQLTGS
jgi:integrase